MRAVITDRLVGMSGVIEAREELTSQWQRSLGMEVAADRIALNNAHAYKGIGLDVVATGTNAYRLDINIDKSHYPNHLEYALFEDDKKVEGNEISQSGV
ncbi:hypothetical protein DMA11_24125, partial [Marinilabiliaceae bacterium JC017]